MLRQPFIENHPDLPGRGAVLATGDSPDAVVIILVDLDRHTIRCNPAVAKCLNFACSAVDTSVAPGPLIKSCYRISPAASGLVACRALRRARSKPSRSVFASFRPVRGGISLGRSERACGVCKGPSDACHSGSQQHNVDPDTSRTLYGFQFVSWAKGSSRSSLLGFADWDRPFNLALC